MGNDNRTMADMDKTTRTGTLEALGEDVNDHIDTFLRICELFKIKDVDGDAIKLRVFPFTLTGTAKEWLKSNAPGETLYEAWERLNKYLRKCP
ncbi:hypothetical protein Tco_0995691 [Tanacetum coccineum]